MHSIYWCNLYVFIITCYSKVFASDLKQKYILQWSPPHSKPHHFLGEGRNPFIANNCAFTNCYVTADKKLFYNVKYYDAIVFDTVDVHDMTIMDFPKERAMYQKYILTATESAHSMPLCKTYLKNFFNWTWTYKLTSDLPRTSFTVYFLQQRKKEDEEEEEEQKEQIIDKIPIGPKLAMRWETRNLKNFKNLPLTETTQKSLLFKNKAAAWLVDECKTFSQREVVAYQIGEELRKLGWSLDIFGRCGKKPCSSKDKKCTEMLKNDYYFYLAFESALATDYVTSVVLTAFDNYVVPVVYGGANYTNFLPPGSYLDATKQKPANIAKKMVELISNPQQYFEYFRWRNIYSIEENTVSKSVCELCEMMNNVSLLKDHSYYADIRKFINEKSKRMPYSPKETPMIVRPL